MEVNNILPSKKDINPYYFYIPSYNTSSAGIKVLHLLCHHLNQKGYPAFLIRNTRRFSIAPNLITPIIDDFTLELHIKEGKSPIVVYPDVTLGNPLKAKCVVRYLLHYAGFFGGSSHFPDSDLIFTYTKKIAINSNIKNHNILFMPISDTKIFYPPSAGFKRSGSCFYAPKYKGFGGKLFDLTNNSIEITRDLPDSQTAEEVAEILRKSEVFYTYEDTSLITEAILCDCPVVLLKNDFFSGETLAEYELNSYGCTTENSSEKINEAKKTISLAKEKFFENINNFWDQFDNFINLTQEHSKKYPSEFKINIPQYKKKLHIGRLIREKFRKFRKYFSELLCQRKIR